MVYLFKVEGVKSKDEFKKLRKDLAHQEIKFVCKTPAFLRWLSGKVTIIVENKESALLAKIYLGERIIEEKSL